MQVLYVEVFHQDWPWSAAASPTLVSFTWCILQPACTGLYCVIIYLHAYTVTLLILYVSLLVPNYFDYNFKVKKLQYCFKVCQPISANTCVVGSGCLLARVRYGVLVRVRTYLCAYGGTYVTKMLRLNPMC